MAKKRKIRKSKRKEKIIKAKSIKIKKEFTIELPGNIKKEDILKIYIVSKKLIVLDKSWRHIKEIILPFFPDRKIRMEIKAGKVILHLRRRK